MSTRSLSADAAQLTDALRATFQQIARFSNSGPQPQRPLQDTEPIHDHEDDSDGRAEIASDIHESLKQHEESLELLSLEIEDLNVQGIRLASTNTDEGRSWIQLVARVSRLGEDLRHARGQFRKAQLTVQRASEAYRQRQRETAFDSLRGSYTADGKERTRADLFAGRRKKQNKGQTEDELLIDAAADLTRGLRQTHEKLVGELSRSVFARQTLADSTAALQELGQRYSGLDDLLSTSKNLVGNLVKSQKTDTWYLETAFYVLCVTLGWLFFRRIVYGPAWYFFWLPLKHLLLRPIYWLFSSFGAGIATSAVSSSAAAILSSTATTALRVQPSAAGGIPKFEAGYRPSVRAGAGGGGAKIAPGEDAPSSVAEQIASMSEQGTSSGRVDEEPNSNDLDDQPQGHAERDAHGDEAVIRGDGTVLPKRDEQKQPRNPKKKTFEDEPEPPQAGEADKDEL